MFIHDRCSTIDALTEAGFDRFEIEDIEHNLCWELIESMQDRYDWANQQIRELEGANDYYTSLLNEISNICDEVTDCKMSAKLRSHIERIAKLAGDM